METLHVIVFIIFLFFSEIPGYRDVEQIWDGDRYHNKIHALLSGISDDKPILY